MSLYERYRGLSDDRWLHRLLAADRSGTWRERVVRRLRHGCDDPSIPRLPDRQVQRSFVGMFGLQALSHAWVVYRVIKARCLEFGQPLSSETRLLDFGCGWGRIIRFFMKDVRGDNLVGVDVDPDIVQVCRATLHEGRYEVVAQAPPTVLPSAFFDVIYAYSVFSHLAEPTHLQWVREFARVLKPGGLVFATTQKRSFIEYANTLRGDEDHPWLRSLATAFRPMETVLAQYDRGEFVYSPTGGGGVRDASFYGDAVVPEHYVAQHWPPDLEILSFDEHTDVQ